MLIKPQMAETRRNRSIRILLVVVTVLMLGDFVVRGIVPAFTTGKNDFSDPYVGAWLWRHNQNPYDGALASAIGTQLIHSRQPVVPIYPPTTFLTVAPLSFFSWSLANVIWAILGVCGVGLIALVLVRMGKLEGKDPMTWLIVAVVFSFAPFHTAIHAGNGAVITIALCLLGVYLASRARDVPSGVVLAVAAGLKPQLGIWLVLFYLVRGRWRVVAASVLTAALLGGIALASIPVPTMGLVTSYRHNLHFWFGTGGQNDFSTANPLRFQLLGLQVLLDPLTGNPFESNLAAYGAFVAGLMIWGYAMLRRQIASEVLALSSLLALSFLPIYHRVYDIGIMTLALAWVAEKGDERLKNVRRMAAVLLLLFLAPGQALVSRLETHLPLRMLQSWWWNLVLAPHAVWILLFLNGALLYGLVISTRNPKQNLISTRPPVGAAPDPSRPAV
jgi:hypothetical protein